MTDDLDLDRRPRARSASTSAGYVLGSLTARRAAGRRGPPRVLLRVPGRAGRARGHPGAARPGPARRSRRRPDPCPVDRWPEPPARRPTLDRRPAIGAGPSPRAACWSARGRRAGHRRRRSVVGVLIGRPDQPDFGRADRPAAAAARAAASAGAPRAPPRCDPPTTAPWCASTSRGCPADGSWYECTWTSGQGDQSAGTFRPAPTARCTSTSPPRPGLPRVEAHDRRAPAGLAAVRRCCEATA